MWNKHQRECMKALGIPMYEFVGEAASETLVPEQRVNDPILEKVPEQDVNDPIFYRLGPWCLQFPEVLPAPGWPWLADLAHFIGGQPTQVSHVPEQVQAIDCSAFAQEHLSPEQKRALWNLLKPALQ